MYQSHRYQNVKRVSLWVRQFICRHQVLHRHTLFSILYTNAISINIINFYQTITKASKTPGEGDDSYE